MIGSDKPAAIVMSTAAFDNMMDSHQNDIKDLIAQRDSRDAEIKVLRQRVLDLEVELENLRMDNYRKQCTF